MSDYQELFFSSLSLSYISDNHLDIFFLLKDKIGSWFSNPGTGTGGGSVGKYLKARNGQAESGVVDTSLTKIAVAKKRKLGVSAGQFKDFSAF